MSLASVWARVIRIDGASIILLFRFLRAPLMSPHS
jgi:hypothetical protein